MISSRTSSSWLTSCLFAPVTTIDKGTPRSSTRIWRLLPFFPPVSRVSTYGLLSQWRFGHRSIDALPVPGDAFHLIVFGKAGTPDSNKEASSHPSHKMSVDGTRTAVSFLGQRLPLAPGTQHVDDRFKDLPVFHRFPAATGFTLIPFVRIALWGRNQGSHFLPEGIRDFPRW